MRLPGVAAALLLGRAVAAQPALPAPVQIAVSDPLLAPPAPPAAEVSSWEQALALVRHSPELLVSIEAVARARAQQRIVLAGILPRLGVVGGYAHNFEVQHVSIPGAAFDTPPRTDWSATATATWSVFNPRALYAVGSAELSTRVAQLSLADQRRLLATSAVSAMLQTLAAARVAEINRVGLRAALERLELTKTRLKLSRGTELDVDRAEQDVSLARGLVIDGDEALRQSREELGRVVGSTTALGVATNLDLAAFERAVASTCRLGHDIEQRADIVAAKQRVAIARRDITAAKLQYAPTLDLSSQAVDASAATLGPKRTWNVMATLTLPIYDGGARYAEIRDAKAAAMQAEEVLATERINALIEQARAGRAIAVRTAQRDVARDLRDLARRIDVRTREGYVSGVGTSLDLVTSAQALRRAEIELIVSELRVAQARADALLVTAECVY
jgi:outer membrane protein, multidrug efflux system